jgi:uncharacterized repeat protein (TIGR02543 family)
MKNAMKLLLLICFSFLFSCSHDTTTKSVKKIDTCTVTFDSVTGTQVESQTIPFGSTVAEPADPTLDSTHTFDGWYRDIEFISPWSFATDTVTADMTLYAQWNPPLSSLLSVIFNSVSGTPVASQVVTPGSTLTEPTPPTLANHVFGGWYQEIDCITPWDFAADTVTANITLYAKWIPPVFTITFNSVGGSSVASQTVSSGSTVTEPAHPTYDATHTFIAWYRDADYVTLWNFAVDTVTANITLYAKWTPSVFTVTFNSVGGSSVASQTVPENSRATTPAVPVLAGRTFNGWYSDTTYTTAWNFSTPVTKNITLYAQWTGDEVFNTADRPPKEVFGTEGTNNQYYWQIKPWNYEKSWNSVRKYPIVVSLHGYKAPTPYAPCFVWSDYDKKTFPCFFIAAHIPSGASWNNATYLSWLITIIEGLKTTYRIDTDRIYLIGFSMGGNGTYYLAQAYHKQPYAQHIAGIVRAAGFNNGVEIQDRTSIWDNVGLSDTTTGTLAAAASAYTYIKGYSGNAAAVESTASDVISYTLGTTNYSYPRKTYTLTKGGIEIMKKSEFTGLGHDGTAAFKDPAVLVWLFKQSLKNR